MSVTGPLARLREPEAVAQAAQPERAEPLPLPVAVAMVKAARSGPAAARQPEPQAATPPGVLPGKPAAA